MLNFSDRSLNKKEDILNKKRMSEFFKYLTLNSKIKIINTSIKQARAEEILRITRRNFKE